MSTDASSRVGSLNQFQIALYASKDKRLSASDLACLFEIVDRFLKDKGVTRPTGKAHLERETGRSNGSVKESVRRLIQWQYISVAKSGAGSRGNEYLPNFEWAHRIADAIKTEVRDRAAAKKQRRLSRAESCPTSTTNLVGRNSAPLRDLVGQPTAPLDVLVGQNSAPQTYVIPTGDDYVGKKSAPGPGASASRQAPARADFEDDELVELTVVKAEVVEDDDSEEYGKELYIWLEMKDAAGGDREDSFTIQSNVQRRQDNGWSDYQRFLRAAGIDDAPDVVNALEGLKLTVKGRHGTPIYIPADEWGRRAMGVAA